MIGVLVGIATAVMDACASYFVKVLNDQHPLFLGWVRVVVAVPVLAAVVTLLDLWTLPPKPFLLALVIILPLEVLLLYTSIKALHLAPLSLIAPLSALTMLFLLPLGYFILGESITFLGIAGVISILLGTFLLSQQTGVVWILSIRNRFTDKGVLFAVVGAFIAAVAITATKYSFVWIHPVTAAFYVVFGLSLVLLPFALRFSPQALKLPRAGKTRITLLGISNGFAIAFHYWGLSLLPSAYFVSLKRLSILINVVMGRTLLEETDFLTRFIGGCLMLAGVVLIAVGTLFV